MAAGNITPLSLAYLIEISFVINLAYHELNSFRFRNSIYKESKALLSRYREMWDGNETLFQPEWNQLKTFYRGGDKAAWEGKLIRVFYSIFLYSGWDRYITRGLLCLIVAILLVCTLFADVNVSPIFIDKFPLDIKLWWADVPLVTVLWWSGYCALVVSIIVPILFMLLVRSCKKYVFGCVEEDDLEIKKIGRFKHLDQEVLRKIREINLLKINGM